MWIYEKSFDTNKTLCDHHIDDNYAVKSEKWALSEMLLHFSWCKMG